MTRAVVLVSVLASLALAGYLFSAQSRTSGPTSHAASTAIQLGNQAAAAANLQQAAAALEQNHAATGSYAGTHLGGFGGVVLVRADVSSYCIQSGAGAGVAHESGPGGTPAPGPC